VRSRPRLGGPAAAGLQLSAPGFLYTAGVSERVLLLSNDDGYSSEGLQELADALEPLGEVWVVAPDRENSAVSHALTLNRPLRLTRLGPRRFAVDGTPTDCICIGAGHVLKGRLPDLVVSGINFGANMGIDVHYSGTVSAAFEAATLGVPALAVSQVVGEGFTFGPAARFARRLAERVLERGLPPGTLLNVNVPPTPPVGVRFTRLGKHRYVEGIVELLDPRGRTCYWIGGGPPVWEDIPGTDFSVINEGFISVTPLHLDLTDGPQLQRLVADADAWMLDEG
jgi:5'-nucleotidase